MPARKGDWNRFGSVAVTQFQRSVCRNALKWRRVEAPGAEVAPRLLLQDAAVDLEVPVHLQGLALGIVVSAGQTHARRLAGGVSRPLLPASAANVPRPVRRCAARVSAGTIAESAMGGSVRRSSRTWAETGGRTPTRERRYHIMGGRYQAASIRSIKVVGGRAASVYSGGARRRCSGRWAP